MGSPILALRTKPYSLLQLLSPQHWRLVAAGLGVNKVVISTLVTVSELQLLWLENVQAGEVSSRAA